MNYQLKKLFCPYPSSLAVFVRGESSDDSASFISHHLKTCGPCNLLVSLLRTNAPSGGTQLAVGSDR